MLNHTMPTWICRVVFSTVQQIYLQASFSTHWVLLLIDSVLMSIGHLDHVLLNVYSSIEHATWKSPEASCIKLRFRKSAPPHPRARIHSHPTLRPWERYHGRSPHCVPVRTKMAANMFSLLKIVIDECDDAIDYIAYFEALEQLTTSDISTLSTATSASVLTRNTTSRTNIFVSSAMLDCSIMSRD